MFKSMEFKVGLFIVIVTGLIVTVLSYAAIKKELFTPMYTYQLVSKTGENVVEGMPVNVSGFNIGKLHSFELTEKGTVILTIKVLERHTQWVRNDSLFILEKPLIGEARIVVETKNMTSPILADKSERPIIYKDGINEIVEKAQPAVDRLNAIMQDVNTATGKLAGEGGLLVGLTGDKAGIDALNKTLKTTALSMQKVDTLLAQITTMAIKTDERLFNPNGALDQVQISLVTINDGLKDAVGKLKKSEAILDNAVKMSNEAGESTKDLKKLRKEVDTMIHNLNNTIDEINAKLPLQKQKKIELP